MSKIFVLGLPRTGTTSVSAFFLKSGYTVAHTAYTEEVFAQAQVVSDVPIFSDYLELNELFPNARYIYLNRSLELWIPSVRRLLDRISSRYRKNKESFNPLLFHAYRRVFGRVFEEPNLADSEYENVYRQHKSDVEAFVNMHQLQCLSVDISFDSAARDIIRFLGSECDEHAIEHLNAHGQIAAWDQLEHPLKVNSNLVGTRGRKYFNYFKSMDYRQS